MPGVELLAEAYTETNAAESNTGNQQAADAMASTC